MIVLRAVLGALLLFLAHGDAALAARKVAVVVGNDAYPALSPDEQLRKAVNDARLMAETLASLGFEVTKLENAGRGDILAALFAATDRMGSGDTGFFFFAGHGVAIDGANYLLPSDIPTAGGGQEALVRASAVPESLVLSRLREKGVAVGIVVLDACRNNPFNRGGTRSLGDAARGLTRLQEAPEGLYGIYSAGDGQTALDRLGDDDGDPNSIFTRILAPALLEKGRSLDEIAFTVRDRVQMMAKSVGHDQRPAIYDEVNGGRIYLAGAAPAAPVASPVPAPAPAAATGCADAKEHYGIAAEIGTAEALEAHVAAFGACPYAAFAKAKLAALAVVIPPPPTPEPDAADAAAPAPDETIAMVPVPPAVPAPLDVRSQSAAIGKWPEGMALVDGRLFVALSGARQLAEVDPETLAVVRTSKVGRLPVGVAALDDGRVLTLVHTDKLLWRRDPRGKGAAAMRFSGCPDGLASNGRIVAVVVWPDCSSARVEVQIVDPKRGKTLHTIGLEASPVTRLAFVGDTLYAVQPLESDSILWRIDAASGDATPTSVPGVRLLAIATDGAELFVGGAEPGDFETAKGVVARADDFAGAIRLPSPVRVMAAVPGRVVAIVEGGTLHLLSGGLDEQNVTPADSPFEPHAAIVDGDRLFVSSFDSFDTVGTSGKLHRFEGWR